MRLAASGEERDLDGGALAAALAAAFGGAGPHGPHRPARRIGILAPLCPAHAAAHLAARRLGATIVPVAASLPPGPLAALLHGLRLDALVVAEDGAAQAPGLGAGEPRVAVDRWGEPASDAGPPAPPPAAAQPRAAALELRTSGTTGPPKPVALGDAYLDAHARALAGRLGCGPGTTWLACLPPWRAGGAVLLDRASRLGHAVVLLERFRALDAARLMAGHQVTHASLVPAQLADLVASGARPPPSLQAVLVGGDALPEELFRQADAAGWPVWPSWGMTETGGAVAVATPGQRRAHPATSGRALEGFAVRSDGGVLAVAGPGGVHVATGDRGEVRGGLVFVHGRVQGVVVTGGHKVACERVEQALLAAGAREACVFGIPDGRLGERLVALVAPAAPPGWQAALHADLERHEVPRELRALPALPRTDTGKVARVEARLLWDTARLDVR